jgi:transketolase
MRDTFIARLTELAENDPRIMLLTGDLGFGVLNEFRARVPRQFLNVGVAEQNMTGLAVGLALEGRIVFTYSIANFPTLRCLEQIRNDACYHDANVKIVAVGGGFSYGQLGMSHHATECMSVLRALPGMTLLAPGDDTEAVAAADALVATPGTCFVQLDRCSADTGTAPQDAFQLGRARRLREGRDMTLVSTGGILGETLAAADQLSNEGIRCRILQMHTLRPFDEEAIFAACQETGGIVSVEEHSVEGGLGGTIAETCLEAGVLPRRFHRIGLRGGYASVVGSQSYLRHYYQMDAEAICNAVRLLTSEHAVAVQGIPLPLNLQEVLS